MRKARPAQLEKNERTVQALFRAARAVVGDVGYARASIAKIAETAGVSIGMCYLHFRSRDELFDRLLPWCNIELSEYLADRTREARTYLEFEERNIRAFLEYSVNTPAFVRVLIEAEVSAPKAWEDYIAERDRHYVRVMTEAYRRGEFPDYRVNEIPQLSIMMIGLRLSLIVRYLRAGNVAASVRESAIKTYLKFVSRAVLTSSDGNEGVVKHVRRRAEGSG